MAGEKAPELRKDIPAKKPEQLKNPKSFLDEQMAKAKEALTQNAKALRDKASQAGQTLIDAVPDSIKAQIKLINAIEKDLNTDVYENDKLMPNGKTPKDLERLANNYLKNLRGNVAKLQKLNPTLDTTDYELRIREQERNLFEHIAWDSEAGEKIAQAHGINVDHLKAARKKEMTIEPSTYDSTFNIDATDIYGEIFDRGQIPELMTHVEEAQIAIKQARSKIQQAKKRGENVTADEAKLNENVAKIYELALARLLKLHSDKSNKLNNVFLKGVDEESLADAEEILEELDTFETIAADIFDAIEKDKGNTNKAKQQLINTRRENKITETWILIAKLKFQEGKEANINASDLNYRRHPESSTLMPNLAGVDLITRAIEALNQASDPKQKNRTREIERIKKQLKTLVDDYIKKFEEETPPQLDSSLLATTNNHAGLIMEFFKFLEKNKYITNNERQRLEANVKGNMTYEISEKIKHIKDGVGKWAPAEVRREIAETKISLIDARDLRIDVKKYGEELDLLLRKNNKIDGYSILSVDPTVKPKNYVMEPEEEEELPENGEH